jgi:hypothetical protein
LHAVRADLRNLIIPKLRINAGVDAVFGKYVRGIYFRIGEVFL